MLRHSLSAACLILVACQAPEPHAQAKRGPSNPAAVAASLHVPVASLPALTGRVVDGADLLTPEQEARLAGLSERLESRTTDQLVIVTTETLGGQAIDAFGVALGRHWRIGQRDKGNGVLLIVAPTERQARIEVGCGLEPILTNQRAQQIMDGAMVPRFRDGAFPAGISAGSEAIVQTLIERADQPRVGGC